MVKGLSPPTGQSIYPHLTDPSLARIATSIPASHHPRIAIPLVSKHSPDFEFDIWILRATLYSREASLIRLAHDTAHIAVLGSQSLCGRDNIPLKEGDVVGKSLGGELKERWQVGI